MSEELLELEQSLAALLNSNEIFLSNLELKADLNRFSFACSESASSCQVPDLLHLFSSYDYMSDQTAQCTSCRLPIRRQETECCQKYVKQQKEGPGSALEREFWSLFLLDPYKTILTLPNYTKMAIHQMGVPFQLRCEVWRRLVLVSPKMSAEVPVEASMIFRNFQHSYNHLISRQIKKDLGRTFPRVPFFQNPEVIQDLLTVLNVYANYDLELGYCQGLLFLVGTLYQTLRSREFTFHAICKIFECEPQVRSIFVAALMHETLEQWHAEFCHILNATDPELYEHLSLFCDLSVFLFQWWLSTNLIHTPNLDINNHIVECMLMQGWKVGIFKVSLGLLMQNRPILVSFGPGDEEVVYQHLLNESKWGNVMSNTTAFFGKLLFSWDELLFASLSEVLPKLPASTQSEKSSVFSRFKNLSLGALLLPDSASEYVQLLDSRSLSSVFSSTRDAISIYSDSSDSGSDSCTKRSVRNPFFRDSVLSRSDYDIFSENQVLRRLLQKAYEKLDDVSLKREIGQVLG